MNIETPCMVLDAPTVRRNINKLADYAKQHNIKIRPHTKTHKSKRMSQLQLEAGAGGLTVAKVGEAEIMAEVSDDILMAYPAVDEPRCERLAKLAHTCTVRVAVDSHEAAEAISRAANKAGSTIGILVDLDIGLHRTGVQSPQAALELAQLVAALPGLRFDGIMCYPGQIWNPVNEQAAPLAAADALVREAITLCETAGLKVTIVSGGSTPTAYQSHFMPSLTEIRPGTYIYNDMNTMRGGYCSLDDCGARIHATVVSTAVPNQVVLDAGNKTLTSDLCIPAPESGHGYIVEYPEARIFSLSEEHGRVDMSKCASRPKVGERVTVIPNHICPCINLQDAVWWRDGDTWERLPIEARGKLS